MKKFTYRVALTVEVEAFDEEDAWEAIQDTFGVGDQGSGLTVTDCAWE